MTFQFNKSWKNFSLTKKLINALEINGGLAYLVGGSVRNIILGQPVNDIDIATNLVPEKVIEISKKKGFEVIETGVNFGTITLIIQGVKFEVTTFRSDIETDGRYATVKFTSDIELDAMRRDFTINSIYMKISGEIVDPLNSMEDLLARKVKFIGNADERIKEDKLRILRFFRFLAEFDKSIEDIDSITLKALKKYKKDLKLISKERLRMELERIISVYTPQKMFSIMIRLGILDDIFPSIKIDGLRQLLKAEKKYHITAPPLVRLLSLNSAIGDKWSKYVALSKKEKRFLEDISQSLEIYSELMVVAYKFGPNVAESWLLNLGNKVSKVKPNEVKKIIENGCKVLFPIKGEDLLEEFEEGPEIGNTLINLEKLWVNSGFKMSKKDLLSKIPTNFKAI